MKVIEVKIRGDRLMTAKQTEEEGKRKKKTYSAEDAKKRLYIEDGKYVFPSTYISAVLREAGKNFKYEGKRSYAGMIRAMIRVNPTWILISPQKFEAYESYVRIPPRTGARVLSYRPLFRDWSAEFEITLLDDDIHADQIKEILEYGGKFLGVGDGRPEFGQFIIEKFQVASGEQRKRNK